MTDSIRLTGIEAFGYHGVLPSETKEGQNFVVDVDVTLNLSAAAASDDLADTVDYGALAAMVVQIVTSTRYHLIEALADDIARRVLSDARVACVAVTVHKPHAPIQVPFVDVSVTRRLP
jgi:dihydroneopterin aldolase